MVVRPSDDEPEEREGRDDREIMISGPWEEWFSRVFLKYCYVALVLFAACMLPLELYRILEGGLGLSAALLSALAIVLLGVWGYMKLWGARGRWGNGDGN
mgnify:CR=1 FL=1